MIMLIMKMDLNRMMIMIFAFEVFGTTLEGYNADDNAHNEDGVEYDDDNDLCL